MVIKQEGGIAVPPSEIQKLYDIGFAVHWLKPYSKMPVKTGWTQGPREPIEQLIAEFRPGFNAGVRLGAASKIKNLYLAVVDLDVKSDTIDDFTEALQRLYTLFPQVKDGPFLQSGRGNGSAHYYILIPEPVKGGEVKARSRKLVKVKIGNAPPSTKDAEHLSMDELADGYRMRPAWEIQLLSEGRQAVLVGAIHPDTGKRYTWGKPILKVSDIPIVENFPVGMNGEFSLPTKERKPQGVGRPADRSIVFQDVTIDDFDLPQHHKDAIVKGTGVVDRSHYLFDMCLLLVQKNYPDDAIISLFTKPEYFLGQVAYKDGRQTRTAAARWLNKYEVQRAKSYVERNRNVFDFDEQPEPTKGETKKKKQDVKAADPDKLPDGPKLPARWYGRVPQGVTAPHGWQGSLTAAQPRKNVPCTIQPTLINLVLIFKNECVSPKILRHDEFTLRDTWTCDTIWGMKKGDERHGGDRDRLRIKLWLAQKYGIEPSLNLIDEALNCIGDENRYHSLRDYLNGLSWDGVPRIGTFFRDYYGAIMPEPYLTAVSLKFFQACIRRAFEPGSDFDHVIVLMGLQGKGKTKSIQILCGREWFVSGLPSFKDKDSLVNIQGKWLCELGELTAITRSGNNEAKDYISKNVDTFRPPYGRTAMQHPRSTIFVGTTDNRQFLSDTHGNRRFWPVDIEKLDFDALHRDRDQLWAEAMDSYFFDRQPWWLEGEADAQAKIIQEGRRAESEEDTMKDLFIPWFVSLISDTKPTSEVVETDWFEIDETDYNSEKGSKKPTRQDVLDSIKINTTELFATGPLSSLKHSTHNLRKACKMLYDLGFQEYRTKARRYWQIDTHYDWMGDG